jgi:methylglutaconyl-CoA hydratase
MRASADLGLDENVADANALRRMFEAIDTCPAPVLSVVHGHALGGGVGLVACSDVVISDPATVFAFSEVKLGIVPAVISPFALRKIGESAARRFFVTGERFDAATALRIGLVHEVSDDVASALERVLGELRTAGPRAARHAKRLVLDRPDGAETARRIAERRTSEEGQEGLRAFLERRRPAWAPGARRG